jgi:diguanylate cyclase (GGDEF)-like protein
MKILLADDSPFILSVISEFLEKTGHEVVQAEDGIKALEAIFKDPPDIIILDVIMPYMTGYQVSRVIKSDNIIKDIPIILLTSKSDAADRFWGYTVGADYYIVKDDNLEVIGNKLKEVIPKLTPPENKKVLKRNYSPLNILSKVNELLDKKLYELTVLNKIGELVAEITDYRKIMENLGELLSNLLDYSFLSIITFGDTKADVNTIVKEDISISYYKQVRDDIIKQISKTEKIEIIEYIIGDNLFITNSNLEEDIPKDYIYVNIIDKNKEVSGIILLGSSKKKKFSTEEKNMLQTIANYSFLVVQSAKLYATVQNLSIIDPLTQIYNHGFIIKRLEEEFKQAERYGRELSIIMADIDFFKKVNDTYGHQTGDYVLKIVARIMEESVREIDIVGRYGGEEFLLILPETGKGNTKIIAERIRQKIEQQNFSQFLSAFTITISSGVAEYTKKLKLPSELIKQADTALYKAKEEGRNRVVVL